MKSAGCSALFVGLGLGVSLVLTGCGGGGSNSGGGGGGSNPPTPTITSISPTSVMAGSAAVTLTVNGTNFLSTSIIQVNGMSETTAFVNATQLTAAVPATQIVSGGQLAVAVLNGSVSSAQGTPMNFTVNNPVPAISSVSPTGELAGVSSPTITVTGTGFVPTTFINVNGNARTTTYSSETQVSVALAAADVAAAGSLSLTAVNAAPGGGTSTAATVTVTAPSVAPTITSISPSTETVGANSLTIAVTGTGFVATTVIDVNGSARTTTYTSGTKVSAVLTTADVAATGSLSVTAVSPAPGGGTSAAFMLAVNNPTVGAITLNPAGLTEGGTTPVTITVAGSTFVPSSVVKVNGNARTTAYLNANSLTFVATVADQATVGLLAVTVTNPAPGGGTSPAANLGITAPGAPQITSVTPNPIYIGSGDTSISVNGSGFTTNSVVNWNGTTLVGGGFINSYYGQTLLATVPAADLTTAGTASVTVNTPGASPSLSNPVAVAIANPPAPTLASIYPSGGPVNTSTQLILYGTGFTQESTVAINGVNVAAEYNLPTQLTATVPASAVALPGNLSVTVTNPPPGGGTTSPLAFTAYIGITNNDIAYNAADGLLYASVPGSEGNPQGNSIVGIDPATGTIMRQIWVGSNPNKLALSTDGTQLFVGLDGAASVAQVDLNKGKVVDQFALGGGVGVYNPTYTATFMAAVPGNPNSVAVEAGDIVTVYDSGTARVNTSQNSNYGGSGPICFGSSSSTLYVWGAGIDILTIDSTGITAATALTTPTGGNAYSGTMQYDNGRLYLSNGQVYDASAGTLLGTFYSGTNTAASGPVVSDSTLGRAFLANESSFNNSTQIIAYEESTFNPAGTISLSLPSTGYSLAFQRIVRWGQDGLAVNTTSQIYIFQSSVVQDLSASPADLSVAFSAPSTAATGSAITYSASINNLGPNAAQDTTLSLNLDPSLIIGSVTSSQGTCIQEAAVLCNLGDLANGSSVTVSVSATPTNSGTLEGTATVNSVSYDPAITNNQATTSTTVTGREYAAVPAIASISPAMVQSGASDFTLTVNGTGFVSDSVVDLGSSALSTTYESTTQLTAQVTASQVANYGWASITVTNPAPGGGTSGISPLTIYALVSVPANAILFNPFSQQIYASVPSASTTVTGNSIVTIDPITASVGTPIDIGSEPNVMAETSDGDYLYVGLSGADGLAQFDLLTQKVVATIPLTLTQDGESSPVAATWLAAMPGSDSTLAVNANGTWGNFGIFDVSGSTGSFRTNLSGIYEGIDPEFADASHVYAYDSQTSGAEFYRYSVTASGLTLIDGTTLNGLGGSLGSFQIGSNGLVYGDSGGIVDALTTPPSQIAVLPTVESLQLTGPGVGVAADPSTNSDFLMMENTAGTWSYALARYNLTTYLPDAWIPMPTSLSNIETGWSMLRWGQDGLALLASVNSSIDPGGTTEIVLLRGPFVTPQLLGTDTAATLTSSSQSSFTHGAGNTLLTLTGSNFQPGVAVTWNGSYRTTTIVDATHVTVAIPVSDLAATGSATVVATNPGGAASNSLTITIN